ncbi:putative PrgY-like protein, pheromone shutdown like protein [Halovivax ruber XH-70]|uniref:Putative PrgY-like protein, pheromone shutdown like protein n=1 Tax=Halovivax ruber (strain DSM 18193 / JCM 13892 / XH-70) TaxID=797302 RepID=L0IBH4_HALRX|nr:TraB/GumN family protein [Halovivax ruber]AGB16114.1 putative PrgY-like protein, pheromone shutdown like protein [Halovivax ruber XH-70]
MSDVREDGTPRPPDPPDRDQGEITVVGTAHVSQASVDEVRETIEEESPDVVAVELDEGRYRQMKGGTPDDIEAADLLSGNTVFQFLAYWMLSYVQSQLGDRFDVEPGADMKAAIDTAERNGLGVALVDRDIQVTMQRFWSRLTIGEKAKLVGGLAFGVTKPTTVGLSLGAGFGALFGLLFAIGLAPMLGMTGLLTLGISSSTILGTVGAVAIGLTAGALFGLLFVPSLDSLGDSGLFSGFSLRLLAGVVLGVGAMIGVVATNTYVGPLSAGAVEHAGALAIRTIVGILAGVGIFGGLGIVLGGLFAPSNEQVEDFDDFDIDQLTDGDVVTAMMEEFRRFSPGGAEALIDERDAFIANRLHALRNEGYHVVAVVGAGHRAGIEQYLDNPTSLPPIESITGTASGRRFSIAKVVGYLMMIGFVAFFGLLLMAGVENVLLLKLFLAWFFVNGIFAFSLARLAGARLSSAAVGGGVAWLTSINPLLAPGWFAGYMELRHRPVNVSDIGVLNDLLDDTERPIGELFDEMLDVELFRLIVIVALTNVGSMIASALFILAVIPWFGGEIGGVSELLAQLMDGAGNSLETIVGLFE